MPKNLKETKESKGAEPRFGSELSELLGGKDRCRNCKRKVELSEDGYCELCHNKGDKQQFAMRQMFIGFYYTDIREAQFKQRTEMINTLNKTSPEAARELCKVFYA